MPPEFVMHYENPEGKDDRPVSPADSEEILKKAEQFKDNMLTILEIDEKDKPRNPTAVRKALSASQEYGNYPWMKDIAIAAFWNDVCEFFRNLGAFIDFPWAKEVMLVCAPKFPSAALDARHLAVYADKPWAEEVIAATLKSRHFQEGDLSENARQILLEKPYAQTVLN